MKCESEYAKPRKGRRRRRSEKIIIIKFFACLFAFKQNFFILFFCTRMLCNVSVCCCECVRVCLCVLSAVHWQTYGNEIRSNVPGLHHSHSVNTWVFMFACCVEALHQFLEAVDSVSTYGRPALCGNSGHGMGAWNSHEWIQWTSCVTYIAMKIVIMVVAWPEFLDIWPLSIVLTIFFAYSSLFIILQCRQVRRTCFSSLYSSQSLIRALLHMKCGWSLANRHFSFEFFPNSVNFVGGIRWMSCKQTLQRDNDCIVLQIRYANLCWIHFKIIPTRNLRTYGYLKSVLPKIATCIESTTLNGDYLSLSRTLHE